MSFDVPEKVRANQQARALARRPQPCGEGVGHGLTCQQYPATLYPRGWRCPTHIEAAGLIGSDGHPGAYGQQMRDQLAADRAAARPEQEAATA